MRYIKKTLFLFAFCIYALIGMAQQKSTSNIRARAEIHSDRILLRWIPSDAKSWDLLNQYGVRLERLTVSRSGVVLDKPELKSSFGKVETRSDRYIKTDCSTISDGSSHCTGCLWGRL